MEPTLTDWIQAIASVLTLGAALLAVLIAWRAPEMAASYAEKYRRQTAEADEQRSLQLLVFRALMKGRSEILNQDTRAAINLVEAAFPKVPKVRAARRMFTKTAAADPFDAQAMIQAYIRLVEAVAEAVGLGDDVDQFDLESGYYPRVLGMMDEAAIADATAKLAQHAAQQGRG